MIKDYKGEILTQMNQSLVLLNQYELSVQAESLKTLVDEKLASWSPTMMFYGCYNAGKSTLLNAIMSENVAKVSDRPETSKIEAYPWSAFTLYDAPGIDAPADHEKVSKEHLRKSDIILFVVSDSGSFDEADVINELLNLIEMKKPLMVVINNKSGLGRRCCIKS